MDKDRYFISCDWGTTNFRLRLVAAETLEVLYDHRTDGGIKKLHAAYSKNGVGDREAYFANYLREQLAKFPPMYRDHLIVISGMASSNLGLRELAYAPWPFDMGGEGLYWEKITYSDGLEILLISGISCESGLIRGEETQAIGLEAELSGFDEGILLLPGTHCKHLSFRGSKFTGLQNFMTGEMFEILSTHSILSHSVNPGPWDAGAQTGFTEGVVRGLQEQMTGQLLAIRARDILEGYKREKAYYYLSGLLIADELACLRHTATPVFLVASGLLNDLYKTALEIVLPKDQIKIFDKGAIDRAMLTGQKKIRDRNEKC